MFKSGFVSIIGRVSVGKSTFLNNVLGEKVSIVSEKPQTTRNQILGIKTGSDYQIVFIDTPGIHKPKHQLGEVLSNEALSALSYGDVILYMVDREYSFSEDYVIRHLKNVDMPVLLVINKIDLLKSKMDIDKVILSYLDKFSFSGVYPISSKNSKHIDRLLIGIKELLPEGLPFYEKDKITTQTDFMRMSEIIREKVLTLTKEEVPHSVAVIIEYAQMEEGIYTVYANIIVERDSQKRILIGKQASMLKEIGTLARKDINEILQTRVHLNLYVKVKKDWRRNIKDINLFGYGN
ncbi:MAG: GTPase Era [Acholeplasmatales bacterium]